MPLELLAQLGRAQIEQERAKQNQKREQTMMKMRVEELQNAARDYTQQQQGASEAMQQVAPVVALWQNQAAQNQAIAAQSAKRAANTTAAALSLLSGESPSPDVVGTLGDSFKTYRTLLQAQLLENPDLIYTMSPIERRLVVGEQFQTLEEKEIESTRKALEQEQQQTTRFGQGVIKDWNSQVNELQRMLRSREVQFDEEEKRLIRQQIAELSQRYLNTLRDVGYPEDRLPRNMVIWAGEQTQQEIGGPGVGPQSALAHRTRLPNIPLKPPLGEGGRYPAVRGGPVYPGRTDIVYGRQQPLQYIPLTPEQEQEALMDAYVESLRETFPTTPQENLESMAAELIETGGVTPRDTEQVRTALRTGPRESAVPAQRREVTPPHITAGRFLKREFGPEKIKSEVAELRQIGTSLQKLDSRVEELLRNLLQRPQRGKGTARRRR